MRAHNLTRLINWRFVGPLLACVAVALAILVMAVRLYSHREHSAARPSPPAKALPSEELGHELSRCQLLGAAAQSDRDCIAAWAENRRRFFGGKAR